MEKGTDVMMFRQIRNEFLVAFFHRFNGFIEGNTSRVYDRFIVAKYAEYFYGADAIRSFPNTVFAYRFSHSKYLYVGGRFRLDLLIYYKKLI